MSGGICDGRVVVITGAGNGIGRAHALAFAAQGARVVVNDLGGGRDGEGASSTPAQKVVDEIVAAGGQAVANTDNVADWAGSGRLIAQAIDTFGGLDVLVNNAGILRDRTIAAMSEQEWDAVIAVHLKGAFAPLHHAAEYWRERAKGGAVNEARVINTTSPSGLFGNPGQGNYAAAKAGIAALTIVAAQELARYGVTVNAIAPTAMTRLTKDIAVMQQVAATMDLAPEAVSPLVVWLGSAHSREVTGRVFAVAGSRITVVEGWVNGPGADRDGRWDPEELTDVVRGLVAKASPNADPTGIRTPHG